jgi:hypothetical protein
MQPGMAAVGGPEWQQGITGKGSPAASMAAFRAGARRIPVEPLCDAAIEGAGFGLIPWQSRKLHGSLSPRLETGQPIFARPAVIRRAKQCDHLRLMAR